VECRSHRTPTRLALALALALAGAGCGGAGAADAADYIDGGYNGDASPRPLAIVADRVSDKLDLYAIEPALRGAAELSVDENPGWIDEPFDLALAPDHAAIYVVMGHSVGNKLGTLLKLRLSDGARLAEVVVGEQPSMVALSADGRRAYVSLFRNFGNLQGPWTGAGALVVVDTEKMEVLGETDVCAAGLGVALDEPRQRVWVACVGSNTLARVDVSGAPRVEDMVTLDDGSGSPGDQAAYVVLDDNHAFVTAQGSGDLWIFDRETAAFEKRISFGSDAFPQRMALLGGDLVLVCVDYLERLAAVSRSALEVIDTVPLDGFRPQGIAVTPDGHWAVISDENDLVHVGRALSVDLTGIGSGGAHVVGREWARVFPQAVLIVP
jgi:DNA-binding beta-propeller fold protein YncE